MNNEKLTRKVDSKKKKLKGKNEEKQYRFCQNCRFYDHSTEREFRRKVGPKNEKGERTEIVEIRAVCRNPKAKSFGHLVMSENKNRQCSGWEKVKHIAEATKRVKIAFKGRNFDMTMPEKYFGIPEKRLAQLRKRRVQ